MEEVKKLPGRGVYVCPTKSCIEDAFKVPKRINALLRVQLSKSVITEFKQALLDKITHKASTMFRMPPKSDSSRIL